VAEKHPYSPGGPGGVTGTINQLRKSFPKTVDADTLRKLSIAPKNESYIINILRFIGAIDTNGTRSDQAGAIFTKSDDEFKQAFEGMVKTAYADLFELYNESAWTLAPEKLQSYFRGTDQTSELVGRHQATTFQILASFAGHGEPLGTSGTKSTTKTKAPTVAKTKSNGPSATETPNGLGEGQP
jgi:hypothetical protein